MKRKSNVGIRRGGGGKKKSAARTNPYPAVQLQLEEFVGSRWAHLVELLLSYLCRYGEKGASAGFSPSLGAPPGQAAVGGVGSLTGTPEPAGARLHCQFAGLDCHGLSAGLCSGAESGR